VAGPFSELLDHTGEVRVRVRAPSFGELAAETGRALARIQLGSAAALPAGPWRMIEVQSTDRAALLVDWLNELIFLAETERWVPVAFQVAGDTGTELRVRARGIPVEEAIRPIAGGLEAEVVFDV
jgi:SHS2 domain-containing protein